MRKLSFPAAMLMLLLCGSCDSLNGSDVIWDIAGIEYSIMVEDSVGNDLLNPAAEGNILSDVQVIYQDSTYVPTVMLGPDATTRAYMPSFHGVELRQWWNRETFTDGRYYLSFGEFSGEENGRNEMVFRISALAEAALSYTNNFSWKKNGDPKISRTFYCDGQPHASALFRFRLLRDADGSAARLELMPPGWDSE